MPTPDPLAALRARLAAPPADPAELLPFAVTVAEALGPRQALPLFERLVALAPAHPAGHLNLGVALAQTGRPAEAVDRLERAVRLDPGYAEAHFNRGNVLRDLGRRDEAIAAFREAIRLKPDHGGGHNNLGLALLDAGRPHEAAVLLKQAVRLDPRSKEFANNAALAQTDLGRWGEAEAFYERALALDPLYAECHANLAGLWKEVDRVDESLAGYDLALRLQPDSPSTRYNRSLALLKAGDYPRGFVEYEWRWRRESAPPRAYPWPRWQGEDVRAKRLLLWCEQGLGDAIQFVRFAQSVTDRGATTVVECPPPLVELFRTARGIDQVVAEGDPLPACDYHCPLMSVPGAIGTTLDTLPAAPYLTADPERVARWRAELNHLPRPRLGLVWQGNPRHKWDRFRSLPLAELVRLADPAATLVGLQQGHGAEQLAAWRGPRPVHTPPQTDPGLRPFVDTAALLAGLDGLLTVDTAVAHLAGALGVPTRLVLRRPTDWRWLAARDDTPWYPSVRLDRTPPRE